MAYKDKQKQNEYQRNWLMKRRQEWLLANGPCKRCNSWLNLEVDHIDRSRKVSHNVWSWSKERREAELAKCQVLCEVCHLKKTKIDLDYRCEHGTDTGYRYYKCKCALCTEAHRKANQRYR